MKYKYQIILLGKQHTLEKELSNVLYKRIKDLNININCFEEICSSNFNKTYKSDLPTFCLYFGGKKVKTKDLEILDRLIADATMILPIVSDLRNFSRDIPTQLHNTNAYELNSNNKLEGIVSYILEGLSLLRLSRRLFISYKRNESSAIAVQLFERLEKNGFDVFLDTHSIKPGESFQDELWHRMADTDIVVLLNTQGFLKSHWTSQELAKANSMSIGIFQLIWPNSDNELNAQLSIPYKLKKENFGNKQYMKSKNYLTEKTMLEIVSQIESIRARSLASRQDNIIKEFCSAARKTRKKVYVQPEKMIVYTNKKNRKNIFIPTIGVPHAFTYNQSEELVKRSKTEENISVYLLFDHRSIREKWLEHLEWLDSHLPIKSLRITEAEKWLREN